MCFANRFMLYAAVQLVHNLRTFQNADNVPVRCTSGHPCLEAMKALPHWRFAFYITLLPRDSGAAPVQGFSTLCSVWRSSTVYSVPACTLRSS